MDLFFKNDAVDKWKADCMLVFSFEKEAPSAFIPTLWGSQPWLLKNSALRDYSGKDNEQALIYSDKDQGLGRVLFIGLGKSENLNLKKFRNAVALATQFCRERGFDSIALCMENIGIISSSLNQTRAVALKEVIIAFRLGLYRCTAYRSEQPDTDKPNPSYLTIFYTEGTIPLTDHAAVHEGEDEAAGVILARDLINGPANHITPSVLADEAGKLAKAHGFTCTVLKGSEISQLGMGALWAVGKGAREKPVFIILEHCPKGKENDAPVIIVGKGITFDSGGISLKPSAKMHEMKGDMGGAAAVLGCFAAIGTAPDAAALPRVIGLIPSAENMPGGFATRPGDIVTTMSGKTVEIINTDAEGRLILCDALSYAQSNWKPSFIIDLATLTGACVVALGDYGTGLFTTDSALRNSIMNAAEFTGDLVWPLPLWDEYDSNLKSDVADMSNVGPREGGAINAALFLKRFIEKDVRWAHLDIAGPGYVVKASALSPVPGGTGAGVRILCRLLREMTLD